MQAGNIYGGKYSKEEIQRIMNINSRPAMIKKPNLAFYQKSALEVGPSYAEKKEVT